MIGALVTWWPVLALLYVPRLAQMLAGLLARRSRGTLDHAIPDALPMTAGEWLTERLARRGDPVAALATSEHPDGYRPGDQLIQLTDETYFKADPVSSGAWWSLLGLAFVIPDHVAARILRRLAGPGVRRTSRYLRALGQGMDLVRAGNRRLRELTAQRRDNPPWPERIFALIQLGYVPLLVAIWLS